MNIDDPIKSVRERLGAAAADGTSIYICRGREFLLHPEVFPPTHFQSTGIFTNALDYNAGHSFLELGCGAGVTAITAALEGCCPVVASDINASAVANTQANIEKHELQSIVSARQGDLFDVLDKNERFDTIFWNSNFVFAPENYKFTKNVYRAFCDPGYITHRRFLNEAPNYLTLKGRLLLGFSSQGNKDKLLQLLAEHDYCATTIMSELGVGPNAHRYEILHLTPIHSKN